MALRDIFVETFGREPTGAENDYFEKRIKDGYLTEYEAGRQLQGEPEALERRLPGMADKYAGYLGQGDTEVLGKASDVAQSNLARMGRPDTSTLTAAIASAGRDLALRRGEQKADFMGQGLQAIFAAYANRGTAALNRSYGVEDSEREWGHQVTAMAMMRDSYNEQLKTQGRQNLQSSLVSGGLGIVAHGAGAYAGSPTGSKQIAGLFGG